jgi:hypothetical protein
VLVMPPLSVTGPGANASTITITRKPTEDKMIDNSTSAIGGERKFEGRATRAIEERTSRAPSTFYLGLAIASMVGSAAIMATDLSRTRPRFGRGSRSGLANFVGQWAPTLLVIGLYNKIVKLERELLDAT